MDSETPPQLGTLGKEWTHPCPLFFQNKQWPLSAGMLVTHHLQKQPLPKYHSWPISRERIWGWRRGRCWNQDSLTSSTAESDRDHAWWPKKGPTPKSEVFDPHHGWWKSHHPLSSLMTPASNMNEWLVTAPSRSCMHLRWDRRHKSIPCLKITLLRIETETQAGACTHTALRKGWLTELEEPTAQGKIIRELQSLKAEKASWGYSPLMLSLYRWGSKGPDRKLSSPPSPGDRAEAWLELRTQPGTWLNVVHSLGNTRAYKANQGQSQTTFSGMAARKNQARVSALTFV